MADNRKNVKVASYVKAALKDLKSLKAFSNESEVIAYLLELHAHHEKTMPVVLHMALKQKVKKDHEVMQLVIT